jgi:hypothetical protein
VYVDFASDRTHKNSTEPFRNSRRRTSGNSHASRRNNGANRSATLANASQPPTNANLWSQKLKSRALPKTRVHDKCLPPITVHYSMHMTDAFKSHHRTPNTYKNQKARNRTTTARVRALFQKHPPPNNASGDRSS